jgi:hypothetical protein
VPEHQLDDPDVDAVREPARAFMTQIVSANRSAAAARAIGASLAS